MGIIESRSSIIFAITTKPILSLVTMHVLNGFIFIRTFFPCPSDIISLISDLAKRVTISMSNLQFYSRVVFKNTLILGTQTKEKLVMSWLCRGSPCEIPARMSRIETHAVDVGSPSPPALYYFYYKFTPARLGVAGSLTDALSVASSGSFFFSMQNRYFQLRCVFRQTR